MALAVPPMGSLAQMPFSKVGYALDQQTDQLYAQTPYCPGPQNTPTFDTPKPPFVNRSPGDIGPLGATIFNSGEDRFQRRLLTQNRGFPGDSFITQSNEGPIMIQSSAYKTGKGDPMFGDYTPELFMTPYDREEEKESLGVFTNPYTGETAEMYQDAMPPPNRNATIMPGLFRTTNPRLIWLNGGEDPNLPTPNKKEIPLAMPGSDQGRNPWGTQLYANQIGCLQTNLTARQVFNNRNGIYPSELGFAKEVPYGYTGLRNDIRWTPYLPPTQHLDIKDWTGTAGVQDGIVQPNTNPLTMPDVFTHHKVDLTNVFRVGGAEVLVGDFVPPEQLVNKPSSRGIFEGGGTETGLRPNLGVDIGGHVILDYDPRPTLKTATMEEAYPLLNAQQTSGGSGYVILDYDPRPTLKTATMEEAYPMLNANNAQIGGPAGFDQQDNGVTRRQFYSDRELMGPVGGPPTGTGDNLGPGGVTFQNYRGNGDFYEVGWNPVKIIAQNGGDSSTRWIGQNERDSRTEMVPHVPQANFTQSNGVHVVAPVCVPDIHEPWKMKQNRDMEVYLNRNISPSSGVYYAQ